MTTGRPSVTDVFAARRRLAPYLSPSPLRRSPWLSGVTTAAVHLKIESILPSHAFKIRGAFNAALCLAERQGTAAPLVTASAGNHGRALAIAAEQLGLRVTVFTPATAPATKKAAIRAHGATLDDSAPDYDAAEQAARTYAERNGALYLSPYNHPDVIAGAGTIALEILESLPDLEVVVVPLGGGGLASGLGLVLEAASPRIEIVGVEAAASMPFAASLARGEITTIDAGPSLADGLTGNLEPGSMTFDLVRRHVDRLVSVGEDDLARAIRGLACEEHLITEGAGAAATAAVLASGAVPRGARAVVMVTGGNIDLERFAAIVAG
jgi:threonine dehydratase